MKLFSYTQDHFSNAFPEFQSVEQKNLYSHFDADSMLREASYYQWSRIEQKYIRYRSLHVHNEKIVETFGSFTREWVGAKGTVHKQDKDQYVYEEQWARQEKIKQILSEMVAAFRQAEQNGISEVDEAMSRETARKTRDQELARANFKNWPMNLSEKRFETWKGLNPDLTATQIALFFAALEIHGLNKTLNEDQLGAALSKWLRTKSVL